MTKRTRFLPVLITGVALTATPACYTLLKHPKVKRVVYEDVDDNRCSTCHSEQEVWGFHHPPNRTYPDSGYDAWWNYYEVPWWYNSYWYYDPDGPVTIPLPERQLRPGEEKDLGTTTTGGGTGGTTRVKLPTSPSGGDTKTKAKNDDNESKKRTVRPKKKKDGNDDG
jgi:hypothetical protein